MAGWKKGRRAAILGVAVTLVGLGVTPASAHYVYQRGDVYESSGFDQCVNVYAETSHGKSGDGYMKGTVSAYKSYMQSDGVKADCAGASDGIHDYHWNRPSQNLAIKDYYFRLNPNPKHNKAFPADWSMCEYSDWFYNQKTSYRLSIAGEMRGPTICGSSYYGTLSVGDVNNGGWIGGSVWSGGHRLPTSGSSDSDSSTSSTGGSYYDGISNFLADATAGEIGTDGLLNPTLGQVTIAGSDGNPVVNPLTGQPYLVDLAALSTPPTNLPGNVTQVATDLSGTTTRIYEGLPDPTPTSSGPRTAQLGLDEEFYVVPMHVAAEAITGAP